jgi:hypothetical protein
MVTDWNYWYTTVTILSVGEGTLHAGPAVEMQRCFKETPIGGGWLP